MREIRSPLDGIPSPFAARVSAAPSFTPASLFASGEDGAWYDPSDLSTLFQDAAGTTPVSSDGDSVRLILDKSGNNNHAVAPSDASRPLYKTAGGLHWLDFDGVDDMLENSTFTDGAQTHFSVAFDPDGSQSVFAGLICADHASSDDWQLSQSDSGLFKYQLLIPGGSNVYSSPTANDNPQILSLEIDDAANTASIWEDGVAKLATGAISYTRANPKTYRLGVNRGVSVFLQYKMHTVFMIDRALTTAERSDLEAYLAAKSGVTI